MKLFATMMLTGDRPETRSGTLGYQSRDLDGAGGPG
jgi:hypothetical protein